MSKLKWRISLWFDFILHFFPREISAFSKQERQHDLYFISGVNIDFIILEDGVDWDKMVYNGTEWCRTVEQIGAGWCRIVQIAAGWYRMEQGVADWIRIVQDGASW